MKTQMIIHRLSCLNMSCVGVLAMLLCCTIPQRLHGAATVFELGIVTNLCAGSVGFGINGSGETVGANQPCDVNPNAFRAGNSGSMQNFNVALDDYFRLGGSGGLVTYSQAWDIKDDATGATNEIVGWMVYRGTNYAFWYGNTPTTTNARALAVPSGYSSSDFALAYSVWPGSSAGSGLGYVAAGYVTLNSVNHAAYWSITSTSSTFADLANTYFSDAESVAYGTVGSRTVGYYVNSGNRRAFVIDGNAYDLPVHASATASEALGIVFVAGSNYQYINGYYTSNGYQRPILWTHNGLGNATYTHLAVPSPYTSGIARGVNIYGQTVGSLVNGGTEVACVWNSDGSLNLILNNLGISGWTFTRAYKINAAGWIVGGGTHNSNSRGFMIRDWWDNNDG